MPPLVAVPPLVAEPPLVAVPVCVEEGFPDALLPLEGFAAFLAFLDSDGLLLDGRLLAVGLPPALFLLMALVAFLLGFFDGATR